jgi:hypothetical protein
VAEELEEFKREVIAFPLPDWRKEAIIKEISEAMERGDRVVEWIEEKIPINVINNIIRMTEHKKIAEDVVSTSTLLSEWKEILYDKIGDLIRKKKNKIEEKLKEVFKSKTLSEEVL